jgi:hypothetical protein
MPYSGILELVLDTAHPFNLMSPLLLSGPPISIPRPADFPVIGHLEAEEVEPTLAALEIFDFKRCDKEAKAVMQQYGSWLRRARAKSEGLISLYY